MPTNKTSTYDVEMGPIPGYGTPSYSGKERERKFARIKALSIYSTYLKIQFV